MHVFIFALLSAKQAIQMSVCFMLTNRLVQHDTPGCLVHIKWSLILHSLVDASSLLAATGWSIPCTHWLELHVEYINQCYFHLQTWLNCGIGPQWLDNLMLCTSSVHVNSNSVQEWKSISGSIYSSIFLFYSLSCLHCFISNCWLLGVCCWSALFSCIVN